MVQTSNSLAMKLPGVQREQVIPTPTASFLTAVPAFLGLTQTAPRDRQGSERFGAPQKLTLWTQFQAYFGDPSPRDGSLNTYLADAVHGFFANGGRLCYVVPLKAQSLLQFEETLQQLESLDEIDLVCAPDIRFADQSQWHPMQVKLLEHCWRMGDRFAILDAFGESVDAIAEQQRQLTQQAPDASSYGALYAPWIQVLPDTNNLRKDPSSPNRLVPPCGHVAGIYAQSDRAVGVHKAPANYMLEDIVDLTLDLSNADQQALNPDEKGAGVNCIRAFPGRGIRVWGASTLSQDANWHYLSVRRLFLTVNRWINQNLVDVVFEPNDLSLWNRIERELTTYLESLRQQGALQGVTPQEAFYVKCDAETNPVEQRDIGTVVTEIGLAPTIPSEFIVVRLIHGNTGVNTL